MKENDRSLETALNEVYTKFKLNFYRNIFKNFENREASLTVIENFCAEAIYALNEPTINELAEFINISQPNAAYKVANLVRKGYIKKVQSTQDKGEYKLLVT
ncbi:MAG: MarR family winged helix-turn-helix transcriptional regulator, partial [Gallicola sp.]|nr:MarR family winged helix-turn-helix transcriptional regulator [Gallicola sp.]